jgi:ankyrin repeat protein
MLCEVLGSIDATSDKGCTALGCAADAGRVDVVRLLLRAAATVATAQLKDGMTPLMLAAKGGHTETVQVLTAEGHADVEATDADDDFTPLMHCALFGHEKVPAAGGTLFIHAYAPGYGGGVPAYGRRRGRSSSDRSFSYT